MQQTQSYCVVCGQNVVKFEPFRGGTANRPFLMRLLKVVGSNTDHFLCPSCRSHDRERHLLIYLASLNLLSLFSQAKVLHFAPEKWVSNVIQLQSPELYIKADLFPQTEDVQQMNMLAIPYPDEFFSVVIANHVLEHVEDDLLALSEIRRVLKKGGMAILQTPYSAQLEATFADDGIKGDYLCREVYGQEDHVRLYGRDIFERFSSAGFNSLVVSHQQVLSDIAPEVYGVNQDEPFFLFEAI